MCRMWKQERNKNTALLRGGREAGDIMNDINQQALVAMLCAVVGIILYYVQWFRMWLYKDYNIRGLHWLIQFSFGASIGSMVVWLLKVFEG